MSTHNICLYKEVDKKYTGCNLKTTELLDCALIGMCAVIRSNTVFLLCISQADESVRFMELIRCKDQILTTPWLWKLLVLNTAQLCNFCISFIYQQPQSTQDVLPKIWHYDWELLSPYSTFPTFLLSISNPYEGVRFIEHTRCKEKILITLWLAVKIVILEHSIPTQLLYFYCFSNQDEGIKFIEHTGWKTKYWYHGWQLLVLNTAHLLNLFYISTIYQQLGWRHHQVYWAQKTKYCAQ